MTSLMGTWLDQDLVSGFNKKFIWIAVWSCIAIVFAVLINSRFKLLGTERQRLDDDIYRSRKKKIGYNK
ncbi:hypothetical protein GC105_12215 [Alkalibaculum sp. M08DMB]|uniref:Uncharacterized protein n=1 Tax=Alkalibaculum sporogenes TaxID=2655001 RepID=A0A6A7KC09_9FIRM|nr:hypothetical protein [Alkalibaculum sporogenes]MPW26553.1 hypothetical protein [Alkalibaculum sporogenes]